MHAHSHAPGAHHHSHGPHSHGHAGRDDGHGADAHVVRRLRWALAITLVFLVAEVVGGILSNSLALVADAGHMLTDVAALALSLFVAWFSRQPGTPQKTFGYLRWEILAAFLNGATLLLISAWIAWEAVLRIRSPETVMGPVMLAVSVGGLVVNVIAARLLHPTSGDSLNVRGAYLHVISDLVGSVGTVTAAILVTFTGWTLADPVVSLITVILIVRGAWGLVRESVDVLLESSPAHISLGAVRTQLEAIPGVESVHDLHVWTVTSGMVAMSAHAIVRDASSQQHVLEHVHDAMALFGIGHVTVQIEQSEMGIRETHTHA